MTNSGIVERWKSWGPHFLALLRIVASFVFMQAGSMKLFGYPIGMPPDNSTAQLFTQVGLAGILEFFGGLLLLVGLWTRPIAFILSGEMAVAYFQAHAPQDFWTIVNHGGEAVLFCFIWLYISSVGAGAWSIDGMLARRPGRA